MAGQRALAAVARAADGRGPRTELVAATCAHCGVEKAEDLLGCARQPMSFCPKLSNAARQLMHALNASLEQCLILRTDAANK